MSTALQTLTDKLANRLGLGSDQGLILTLKNTAFKSNTTPTDDQMVALLIVADQYGLNPWTREIYAFPDKNNGIVPVVGVDGWSRIINENRQFNGMDFKVSENMITIDKHHKPAPEWMECIIYRKDRDKPIVVREYLDEVYRPPFTKDNRVIPGPWQSHTKRFLRHKVMIQCARIAFGFVGIYDQDEAERIIEVTGTDKTIDPIQSGNESSDLRPFLIAKCEEAAKHGVEQFGTVWMSLTQEERKIVGSNEKERIKKSIAIAENKEIN